jgi:hypothetical protein
LEVGSWAVLTGLVGHAGFHLLDESGTAGFDCHAGQDGAGGIANDSGNGALGDSDAWERQRRSKHQEGNDNGPLTHVQASSGTMGSGRDAARSLAPKGYQDPIEGWR